MIFDFAIRKNRYPALVENQEKRIIQRIESRRCLFQLFEKNKTWVRSNNYFYSLSHTNEFSAAVIVKKNSKIKNIGIDIEMAHRKVSVVVQKRLVREVEKKTIPLKPIEIWCVKEACFKADPRNQEENQKGLITDYEILSYSKKNKEGTAQTSYSSLRFEFKIFQRSGAVIAVVMATL